MAHVFTDCPELISDWIASSSLESCHEPWAVSLMDALSIRGGSSQDVFPPAITHVLVEERARQSQFDALMFAVQQGAGIPDGTVMLAVEGDGFHGQRGRAWRAKRGNIHLSACFHPEKPATDLGIGLTLVPAVAVLRTLRELHHDVPGTGVKWVNDILVRHRKVAGVISSTSIQSGQVESVVFGIGLNVETQPDDVVSDAAPPPGSLNACWETSFTWQEVAPVLIRHLAEVYQLLLEKGQEPLFSSYRDDSLVIGERVTVVEDADTAGKKVVAKGRVVELHPDLSLTLEGFPHPIREGRLIFD